MAHLGSSLLYEVNDVAGRRNLTTCEKVYCQEDGYCEPCTGGSGKLIDRTGCISIGRQLIR